MMSLFENLKLLALVHKTGDRKQVCADRNNTRYGS